MSEYADHEDRVAEDWQRERPDLDPSSLQVVGRILRLAQLLKGGLAQAIEPLGLSVPGFSVLAALRRSGAPYELTPTELSGSVLLTSGAMTNRIDRLENAGLVERVRSEIDRRSVTVRLTPSGLEKIDQALPAWLDGTRAAISQLGAVEARELGGLLRKLACGLEPESLPPPHAPRKSGEELPGSRPRAYL